MPIDLAFLERPLDPSKVSEREGAGGKQLAYLPSHVAISQANRAFGWGGWGYAVKDLSLLGVEPLPRRKKNKDGKLVEFGGEGSRVSYLCLVEVWVNTGDFGDDARVEDVGYGDATEFSRYEDQPRPTLVPHELAAKEAVSDAVKRCLRTWGDQFGLSLYDKDANWRDAIWHPPAGKTRVGVNEIIERIDVLSGSDKAAKAVSGLCATIWGAETPRPKHVQEDVTRRLHDVLWALEEMTDTNADGWEPAPEIVYGELALAFAEAGVTGTQLWEGTDLPF